QLFTVLDYQHVKQGRGTAFVRAKTRNIDSGAVTEETFRPEDKFGKARIDRGEAQYLYKDGDSFIFMDTSTYDQFPVTEELLGEATKWLLENETVTALSYDGRILGVELPIAVELEVVETEPGFKGDTANAATKPATLQTGAVVTVPLFVNQGDRIRVDTRS